MCDYWFGRLRTHLSKHDTYIMHVRDAIANVLCSPSGRYVAAGSGSGTVVVWDAETGVGLPCRACHHAHIYIYISYIYIQCSGMV